jgi:hypothetical protein
MFFWVSARIHHSDRQVFIYIRAETTLYFAVDSLQKKLKKEHWRTLKLLYQKIKV